MPIGHSDAAVVFLGRMTVFYCGQVYARDNCMTVLTIRCAPSVAKFSGQAMQNTVCAAFLRVAELQVEALRGLNALAPEELRPQLFTAHLDAAEDVLRRRQAEFSRCSPTTCVERCKLFDVGPA
jgi:hypothetical protein